MVLWPSCSDPVAAVDRCFFLAARRVLSFGAPRDASVNSANISRNAASMRARSPVASSCSPRIRGQRERSQTARTLGRKTGGAKRMLERRQPIAYEPLQEPSKLFGVLKRETVNSKAEPPEFSHPGRGPGVPVRKSRS
jgi:hypothetical protein